MSDEPPKHPILFLDVVEYTDLLSLDLDEYIDLLVSCLDEYTGLLVEYIDLASDCGGGPGVRDRDLLSLL